MREALRLDGFPPALFLIAPLFAAPGLLAFVAAGLDGALHPFTSGYLLPVMVAAIMQMLPVLNGRRGNVRPAETPRLELLFVGLFQADCKPLLRAGPRVAAPGARLSPPDSAVVLRHTSPSPRNHENPSEMSHVLLETSAPAHPITLFHDWYESARPGMTGEPGAMTLATADASGQPSARVVLLKEFDERGFVFYTNYESRKSTQLDANPRAALLFWWPAAQRQVRVEGHVEKVSEAESDNYFASRPRLSQIGAWASEQSRRIDAREMLDERVRVYEEKFAGVPVPRPPHWGGWRVVPDIIEFWQERPNRLHDRLRYRRNDDAWTIERLSP